MDGPIIFEGYIEYNVLMISYLASLIDDTFFEYQELGTLRVAKVTGGAASKLSKM